ncbi:MAG: hypothetical protein HQL64_07985 [Magnetococcales bacterium]|nr:hypothetical protein [Magnetococcales bacterium]
MEHDPDDPFKLYPSLDSKMSWIQLLAWVYLRDPRVVRRFNKEKLWVEIQGRIKKEGFDGLPNYKTAPHLYVEYILREEAEKHIKKYILIY